MFVFSIYLLLTDVSTESQKRNSRQSGLFGNKKYMYNAYRCWTCAELYEAFTFPMENIYVQFEGMVYQEIVGIPMGTNCVPFVFILLWEGFYA